VADKQAPQEDAPAFRVTDRRRVGREESPETAGVRESPPTTRPEPPASARAEPAATEGAEGREHEIPDVGTPDLVRLFIAELHTRTLIHLGLIPNPVTRLVTADLTAARLAINCLAALIGELTPSVPPDERDELQQVLTSLRLHFVRQSRG
jgi:hypothetical protein